MKNNTLSLSAINSFLIFQFLFFIDEGFYDFRWMMSWGNWVIFAIYFLILFGLLLLINKLLKKNQDKHQSFVRHKSSYFSLIAVDDFCQYVKKKTPNYPGVLYYNCLLFFSVSRSINSLPV